MKQGSAAPAQHDLFSNDESPAYLSEQLITYIGNKRALLQFIGRAIGKVQGRLGKDRLRLLDLFSGSGIVSRYFKRFADLLVVNDLERYCEVINRCYLANRSDLDVGELESIHAELTGNLAAGPLVPGIITNRYAPQNDEDIQEGERVFYTNRNARYLDTARKYIAALPPGLQHFFLAPLLSEASIHANTAGVFKGFYKDRDTGIGKFGGKNGDALLRIKGDITLPFPVFSNYECPVAIHRKPAEELAGALASDMAEFDLAYLDPPYNQHPYGSNYFMLNLLADYCEPESISEVSGIPGNWERSDFNKPRRAYDAMKNIVDDLPAKFILVSFNSEGFITRQRMMALLSRIGSVELLETSYNTFRGSRNLRNRNIHVKEFLFLVEKK